MLAIKLGGMALTVLQSSLTMQYDRLELDRASVIRIKAYCVGGSKCCALLLYTVKLTKTRAILILPRMWLGQYEYCPATLAARAWPFKLCPELCQCMYKHIRWVFSMFLAVLTSDSIASMANLMTHSCSCPPPKG